MSTITTILATLVALEHFYIFYLESMATQSDATSRGLYYGQGRVDSTICHLTV